MGSPNNVGNPITPPSDFCLKHSLADFREYFKLDEKSVLYNLYYLSHHYDVCRSPSISQVVWSGSRRKTVTLEEHTRHLLKKIENIYLPDIWERWSEDDDDQGMGRHGRTLEDAGLILWWLLLLQMFEESVPLVVAQVLAKRILKVLYLV